MNKKLYVLLLAMVLVLSSFSGLAMAADDEIGVFLDGEAMVFDQKPTIVNNSTLVPMRAFFNSLGASIEWDQATKTVTSVRGDVEVKLTINAEVAYRNGKEIELAVPGQLINNSTYVPLRFVSSALGDNVGWEASTRSVIITSQSAGVKPYDFTLEFPANEYPQTAAHMTTAMANGASNICTIDRDGADDNRSESLAGIPTKDDHDRDEWPMAMCAEGGEGASVAYVDPSDNRGAGSWVGHQLSDYDDGIRVLFIISGEVSADVDTTLPTEPETTSDYEGEYDPFGEDRNCGDFSAHADAQAFFEAAGGPDSDPHGLDRDKDGVVCESLG